MCDGFWKPENKDFLIMKYIREQIDEQKKMVAAGLLRVWIWLAARITKDRT